MIKRVLSTSPLLLDVSDSTKPDEILQRLEAASAIISSTLTSTSPQAQLQFPSLPAPPLLSSSVPVETRSRSLSESHRSFLEFRGQTLDGRQSKQLYSDSAEMMLLTPSRSISRSTMGRERADSTTAMPSHYFEPVSRQLLRSIIVVRFTGGHRHAVSNLFSTFLSYGKIEFNSLTIHRMPESLVVFVCTENDGIVNIPKEQLDFCFMSTSLTTASLDLIAPHIHRIPSIDLSIFDALRDSPAKVSISPDVHEYLRALILASRCNHSITSTTSANAHYNLVLASRLRAVMLKSPFVTPDHIQAVLFRVFRHRLFLERESDGHEVMFGRDMMSSVLLDRVYPPV
ncbi:hypothetical protein BSLG_006331 [Batrachochytrium salamandrivorans]|nr:hypothetical protein BSLG_006331 [Batrachochytrium salamandrivorans]